MADKLKNQLKPEYDIRNPVADLMWYDPRQRYTKASYAYGFNRAMRLMRTNWGVIPMPVLMLLITPADIAFFAYWRVTHNPDGIYPGGDPEPWHKWAHTQGSLKKVAKEVLMAPHPRPPFHYEVQRHPSVKRSALDIPHKKTDK